MQINKHFQNDQSKYHIVVTKTDGHGHSWLGPRCGQDRIEYDESEIQDVTKARIADLRDAGKLCGNCVRYAGLDE